MSAAIAVGALIAALAPLYAMWITFRQTASTSYEARLERENEDLRRRLRSCKERCDELSDENVRLMRKLTST